MADRTESNNKLFSGRVFAVTRDEVELPAGGAAVRDVVRHGGSVAVVPMPTGSEVVLIRQYRFAVGSDLWEIPAGTLETGESPRECAARELEEGTGYRAESLESLAEFYTSPGFCDELMCVFLASGCTPTGSQSLDDDEGIVECRTFPIDEALEMVYKGEIRDGKTIVGLILAVRAMA